MTEKRAWERRDSESNPAYEAFRSYMRVRSTTKVAEELGKSITLTTRWCADHDWVARIIAYDRHVVEAETDGLVHQVAEARDKNLALMDKLRGLLSMRLDDFIERRDDPTIRWTQACMAMAKIEANSLAMKDDQKTDIRIGRIEELVERAMAEREPSA